MADARKFSSIMSVEELQNDGLRNDKEKEESFNRTIQLTNINL